MSEVSAITQQQKKATESVYKRILIELKGYLEALAIAFLIVTFAFNTVGVVGSSMRPNLYGGTGRGSILQSLLAGDRVFIPKYETWLRRAGLMAGYQRGDVVVVREPDNAPSAQMGERRKFFIKRVIGIPGDRIRIDAGQVFINDYKIDQSFITGTKEVSIDPVYFPLVSQENEEVKELYVDWIDTSQGSKYPSLPYQNLISRPSSIDDPNVKLYYSKVIENLAPVPENAEEDEPILLDLIVPPGYYFVMGDNREAALGGSEDSRYFGPIKAISIAGRASAVIWPPKRNGSWNWRQLKPPAAFSLVPDSGAKSGK